MENQIKKTPVRLVVMSIIFYLFEIMFFIALLSPQLVDKVDRTLSGFNSTIISDGFLFFSVLAFGLVPSICAFLIRKKYAKKLGTVMIVISIPSFIWGIGNVLGFIFISLLTSSSSGFGFML